MAVVQNPIIGRAKGQAGNMVFTTQFGKNVIKSKPLEVAYSNTDKQVMRRGMIALVVLFFRSCVEMLQIGFQSLASGMSAYNAFASYNLKNGFNVSSPPTVTPVYANFLTSKGTMAKTEIISAVADLLSDDVVFEWDGSGVGIGQSLDDRPLFIVFNATKNEFISGNGGAHRDDESGGLSLNPDWKENDVIHCYMGFTNDAGNVQSDSDYATTTIIDTTP